MANFSPCPCPCNSFPSIGYFPCRSVPFDIRAVPFFHRSSLTLFPVSLPVDVLSVCDFIRCSNLLASAFAHFLSASAHHSSTPQRTIALVFCPSFHSLTISSFPLLLLHALLSNLRVLSHWHSSSFLFLGLVSFPLFFWHSTHLLLEQATGIRMIIHVHVMGFLFPSKISRNGFFFPPSASPQSFHSPGLTPTLLFGCSFTALSRAESPSCCF
mgnify:CR=1 FL=1